MKLRLFFAIFVGGAPWFAGWLGYWQSGNWVESWRVAGVVAMCIWPLGCWIAALIWPRNALPEGWQ